MFYEQIIFLVGGSKHLQLYIVLPLQRGQPNAAAHPLLARRSAPIFLVCTIHPYAGRNPSHGSSSPISSSLISTNCQLTRVWGTCHLFFFYHGAAHQLIFFLSGFLLLRPVSIFEFFSFLYLKKLKFQKYTSALENFKNISRSSYGGDRSQM